MTKKEIYQLLNNGYKEMCASGKDNPFLVFYTNVGMSLIYVMCGMAKRYKEEEYQLLKDSFDKQIARIGGETKSFLVLSVDSSAEDFTEQMAIARQVLDEKKFSWIFDDYTNSLIEVDTQVEEFYGLKRVLNEASLVSEEEAETIIEKEYYEGPDGRVSDTSMSKKDKLPKISISIAVINLIVLIACHFTGNLIYNLGAGISSLLGDPKEWYRLITAVFIHEDAYHYFSNMLLLGVVAFNIEDVLKPAKFITAYFVSGIIGNFFELLSACIRGEDIMCFGASGAVFGMVGAYVALLLFKAVGNRYARGIWVVLGLSTMVLAGAFATDIAEVAHIVGLLSGLLITVIFCLFTKIKNKGRTNEN